MRKKYKKEVDNPNYNHCFETYRQIGGYERGNIEDTIPSCFNGIVRFRKYKVTIEEIIEPNEVLAERIQKLWDESTNYHHAEPLRRAAISIGYELKPKIR